MPKLQFVSLWKVYYFYFLFCVPIIDILYLTCLDWGFNEMYLFVKVTILAIYSYY